MTRKQMIEDKGYAMTGCTDCGWRGYSDTGEPECCCAEKKRAEEAEKRDPRIDPKPGDVLLVAPIEGSNAPDRGGFRRTVDVVTKRGRTTIVSWIVARLGYDGTLTHWRKINATSEVLHVAD